jgi:hypothetical protein
MSLSYTSSVLHLPYVCGSFLALHVRILAIQTFSKQVTIFITATQELPILVYEKEVTKPVTGKVLKNVQKKLTSNLKQQKLEKMGGGHKICHF